MGYRVEAGEACLPSRYTPREQRQWLHTMKQQGHIKVLPKETLVFDTIRKRFVWETDFIMLVPECTAVCAQAALMGATGLDYRNLGVPFILIFKVLQFHIICNTYLHNVVMQA